MDLFPHNREAYDSAVKLFKRGNRVCVIRPTGTGKSLIIAEFIKRQPSSRHLLLAPGQHILAEVKKHINGANISFSTYIGAKTNRALFAPHSFDFIYLDEFHRLGADVWGNNVERLLQKNPRAKVLGTTATPIRYLDDNRNMATEIFQDCIAGQMSLNSAIANGILPAPTYVSALYSVREELQEMKRKISSSDSTNKEAVIKELDANLIDWERSSGLDTIIKKHLSHERRRVIVFCKDWEHLKYAQKILDPIFNEIFGSLRSFALYSKQKESENEACMEQFSGDVRQAIILYSIDKVNEGLHARNCNTVILLRDTTSPIVFYQQIGRAFSIGGDFKPLIIDLVNNFKNVNLNSFKSDFERELNSPVPNRQLPNREQIKRQIEFIDETQDIRKIFQACQEKIDPWISFYKKAKKFYEKHGHLYVPPADIELCNWVRYQRIEYKRQKLVKERASQLEAIGLVIPHNNTAQWLMRYYELKQWLKEHGRLPGLSQNPTLATWIANQKADFKGGILTTDQVRLLTPLFPLGGNQIRRMNEARLKRLVAHFKTGDIYSENEQFRKDFAGIKAKYYRNILPKEDLLYLRNGNVPIEFTKNDFEWLKNIKRAIAWYKEKGSAPTKSQNEALQSLWTREEKYINNNHFYSKFIRFSKDAEQSVRELQQIILEVRKKPARQSSGRPK